MGEHKRVLVVDDDKLMVAMLSDLLEKEFDVTTAGDGDQAIEALGQNEFDAILCDLHMPTVSGLEVLSRALKVQPDAVRVLITATDKVDEVADVTNQARVHRVMVKPVREVEIEDALRGAIHEVELERENARLVTELRAAVDELKVREQELEKELQTRNDELINLMQQLGS